MSLLLLLVRFRFNLEEGFEGRSVERPGQIHHVDEEVGALVGRKEPVRGHEAEGDEAEGHEEADPEPADQLADGVAGWVLLPPLHPLAALQYAHQLLLNVHRHELVEEGNKIS